MKGVIKWFSDLEGLGVIQAEDGLFCFSLEDFQGMPKEGDSVTFEATNKKISIHDELMPLALNVAAH